MTPCTLIHRDYRFGEICYHHLSPSNYLRHQAATITPPPYSAPNVHLNTLSVRSFLSYFNISQHQVRTCRLQYTDVTRVDPESRQNVTAVSAALPAVTRNTLTHYQTFHVTGPSAEISHFGYLR